MATQWFYGRGTTRNGPYSAKEMKAFASSGALLAEDTVWREGVERGIPARRVKNLFPPKEAAAEDAAPPALVPAEPGPEPLASALSVEAPSPASELAPERVAPPSAWQASPVRAGRATAGKGATIVGQDGTNVKVRKQCTECGHQDSSWVTLPIRTGTTKLIYYCPQCRKSRDVIVIGSC